MPRSFSPRRRRRLGRVTPAVLLTSLLFVIQAEPLVPHGVSFTASSSGASQLGSPQAITATLSDDEGPLANVGVSFTITDGPRTGLGALIYTNPDGRAVWTYTGIGNPGTDTILVQAVVNGAVHSASAAAEWTLPSFGIAGSGSSQLGSPQTVTATLSTNGTPVSDTGVSFRIMSGPREGLGALIYTNPNGQAEWTYTGSGAPGSDVIRASVAFAGIALESTTSLSWTLPTFVLSPAESTIAAGAEHTVRAKLTTNGTSVSGASVAFSITDGPHAGPGPVVPTGADGEAEWTYIGSATGTDTVHAGAAFAGVSLSATALATWEEAEARVTLLGARMSCESVAVPPCTRLGVDAEIGFPLEASGPRLLRLTAVINGKTVARDIDVTDRVDAGETVELKGILGEQQGIRDPDLSFDLAAEGVERFEEDHVFELKAEVSSANPNVHRGTDSEEVNIPLPVVFIHGYTGPPVLKKIIAKITGLVDLVLGLQADTVFEPLAAATRSKPFHTPYINDTDPRDYTTFRFLRWNDLSGSIAAIQQTLDDKVTSTLESTYANRVNLITHSTGGLIARYYVTHYSQTIGRQNVHRLIMVASPNQGVSEVYVRTSGFTRHSIDQLLSTTVGGWLLARSGDLGGRPEVYRPLYDGAPAALACSPATAPNPPLNVDAFSFRSFDSPPPPDVQFTNIYAHTLGSQGKTSWDVNATLNVTADWYTTKVRPITAAGLCPVEPLPASFAVCPGMPIVTGAEATVKARKDGWNRLRRGDGTVALGNACLPHAGVHNVYVESLLPHAQLMSAPAIQCKILAALGLECGPPP